ncbi:hypothetical protein FC17_GL001506 [Secundilactobacillus paracollinoides DSM 15502 = JCM 11969]|nr:hypothetical protein FC17_GL001506 [Secundilactobacillus paracollinoides DSM 15502 = JCM 11969]
MTMTTTNIKKTSKKNCLIYAALVAASMMGVIGSTQTLAHAKGNTDPTSSSVVTNVKALQALKDGDKEAFDTSIQLGADALVVGDYEAAISAGVTWINDFDESQLNAWDALALVRSPEGISTEKATAIYNNILALYPGTNHQVTDYERDIIGLVAIGEDPTNVNGTNLIQETIDGIADGQGDIYAVMYGLLALISADTKGIGDYQSEIDTLTTRLINMQNSDGYWTDEYGYTLDVTGMVMQALGSYQGTIDTSTSIFSAQGAVQNILLQPDTGEFLDPEQGTDSINSSSDAMIIAGLAACDIDPDELGATVSPVDALLSYQVPEGETDAGSFNWQPALTYSRQSATQEAVYTLDQFDYFKANKGSIYNFSE